MVKNPQQRFPPCPSRHRDTRSMTSRPSSPAAHDAARPCHRRGGTTSPTRSGPRCGSARRRKPLVLHHSTRKGPSCWRSSATASFTAFPVWLPPRRRSGGAGGCGRIPKPRLPAPDAGRALCVTSARPRPHEAPRSARGQLLRIASSTGGESQAASGSLDNVGQLTVEVEEHRRLPGVSGRQ